LLTDLAGNALTDVLYGDWNPSGKLPYTIAKNVSDYSGGIIVDSDPVSEWSHIFITQEQSYLIMLCTRRF